MKIKRTQQRDALLVCSDKREGLSLCRLQSPLPPTSQAGDTAEVLQEGATQQRNLSWGPRRLFDLARIKSQKSPAAEAG